MFGNTLLLTTVIMLGLAFFLMVGMPVPHSLSSSHFDQVRQSHSALCRGTFYKSLRNFLQRRPKTLPQRHGAQARPSGETAANRDHHLGRALAPTRGLKSWTVPSMM